MKAKALCESQEDLALIIKNLEKILIEMKFLKTSLVLEHFQPKAHTHVVGGYEQFVKYIEDTGYNGTGHG